MTEARPIEMSVVIPAFDAGDTLDRCLAALADQTFRAFEVVLVDGSPDRDPARRICERYPFVRRIDADPALGAHAKRNIGTGLARGEIFVFTDPDCAADPTWLEVLADAHREGAPVVGGSVGGLPDARNRDIHLCKYAWWLPGSSPGTRSEIPSANTSLTRDTWERFGPYREDRWASDSELGWRLGRAGVPIRFEPRARITHLDHGPRGAFLANRLSRGRDFGRTRAEAAGWNGATRAGRALLAPLVTFVMAARAGRYAADAGRLGDWLVALPFQLVANGCWALGEARGLLSGRDAGR